MSLPATPEIDISEVLSLLRSPNAAPTEYGRVYDVTLSDDIFKQITYAPPITTTIIRRDASAIVERAAENEANRGTWVTRWKKTYVVPTFCPYEFRSSLDVPPKWKSMASFEQMKIHAIKFTDHIHDEDIKFVGKASVFNQSIAKMRVDKPIPLNPATPTAVISIDSDPTILELQKNPTTANIRVFSTGKIIASLASVSRAVAPFDLLIRKIGKDVFISARTAECPALTETFLESITAPSQISRDLCTAQFQDLTIENTVVNAEFVNECKKPNVTVNLSDDDQPPALYRKLRFGEIEVIFREEIDMLNAPPAEGKRPEPVLCRSFTDFQTPLRRTEWEKKLKVEIGNAFTTEIHDNTARVARWGVLAFICKIPKIAIGFSTRKVTDTPKGGHQLYGVDKYTTENINQIITMSGQRIFGALNEIFTKMIDFPDGEYAFVREGRKKEYTIYKTE